MGLPCCYANGDHQRMNENVLMVEQSSLGLVEAIMGETVSLVSNACHTGSSAPRHLWRTAWLPTPEH